MGKRGACEREKLTARMAEIGYSDAAVGTELVDGALYLII